MSSPEEPSFQERNKTLIRSFIEEIFNKHNLSSIERYFGNIKGYWYRFADSRFNLLTLSLYLQFEIQFPLIDKHMVVERPVSSHYINST